MALTLFLSFAYAAGTVIALPSPLELVLGATTKAPAWAVILVAVAGRSLGAYLLFFAGDRLKRWGRWRRWQDQTGKGQKWAKRLEVGINRFGAPALFFFLLVPGFPDTPTGYVLALFNRRPWAFASAFAAASGLRLSLAFWGIYYVLDRP